jgi:hypothetical protein
MNTIVKSKKKRTVKPPTNGLIDSAAKKIVKRYGKTLKLLAKE